MKKLSLLLLWGLLLNGYLYGQVPPCGIFNQVPSSPFRTVLAPNNFVFSPITPSNNLFAAAPSGTASASISVFNVNQMTGFLTPVTGSPFPSGANITSLEFSPIIPPSNTLVAAASNSTNGSVDIYNVNTMTGFFTLSTSTSTLPRSPTWTIFSPLTASNTIYVITEVGDTVSTGHIIVYSMNTITNALTPVASSAASSESFPTVQFSASPFIAPNTFFIATINANLSP